MKKVLPYILILMIIAGGLFSPFSVDAQTPNSPTGCYNPQGQIGTQNQAGCTSPNRWHTQSQTTPIPCNISPNGTPKPNDPPGCDINYANPSPVATPTQTVDKKGDDLYSRLPTCSITSNAGWSGCLLVAAYWLVYSLPMAILMIVGYLFNVTLSLTLSSALYGSTFISEAWRIVRDFSNIFFILILLYVAIKMILGLGGAEVKKMVAQVVVVALLINFSMFFTKVVIDASNILALIFYNKITIKANGKNIAYKPTLRQDRTEVPEKDFAGALVSAFDPSKSINEKTFKGAEGSYLTLTNILLGAAAPATAGLSLLFIGQGSINVGLYLSVIVVAAIIAVMASYALMMAAIALFGRIIELWLCIIFSPFAFMSLTVPKLRGIDYLGWDAWLKRLLSIAFMAPIFLFFLLLITKIIQAPNSLNGLVDQNNPGMGGSIMLIVIPAVIYISLLYKATEYAKKSGGEFASMAIKVADGAIKGVALGAGALALGAATGGVGLAGAASLGSLASKAATSSRLIDYSQKGGLKGFVGKMGLRAAEYGAGASYDARKIGAVGGLMKKIGFKTESSAVAKAFGLGTDGGYNGRVERAKELDEKRKKQLKVGKNDPLMHEKHEADEKLQVGKNRGAESLRQIEAEENRWKEQKARSNTGDASSIEAKEKLDELDRIKGEIKGGNMPLIYKNAEGNFKNEDGSYNYINPNAEKKDQKVEYMTDNGEISGTASVKVAEEIAREERSIREVETNINEKDPELEAASKALIAAEDKATTAINARRAAEEKLKDSPNSGKFREELVIAKQEEDKAESLVAKAKEEKESISKEVKVLVEKRDSSKEKLTTLREKSKEYNEKVAEVKRRGGTLGVSVKELQNIIIPGIENRIKTKENKRYYKEAENIKKKWTPFKQIQKERAHRFIMAADEKEVH